MTILLITLTDSCCQYDLRVHVCFINMQFLKKRYAQKIYLFINRCSHIHESDIWWIIDYFEAILPHFTIFIHCRKPMVSLAEVYWPYSLIIFIFYKLFSINQWMRKQNASILGGIKIKLIYQTCKYFFV